MARYDELDLYICVYNILLDTYRQIHNVPREVRYTLLEALRNDLVDVLLHITKANASRDKSPHIQAARSVLTRVKIRTRLLKDLHCMSEVQYGHFSEQLVSASKQLSGWQRYSGKRDES